MEPRLSTLFGTFLDPKLEADYRLANASAAAFRAGLCCFAIAVAWSGSVTHDLQDLEGVVRARTVSLRILVVSMAIVFGAWLLWRRQTVRWETTHRLVVIMVSTFLVHVAVNNTAFIGSETTAAGVNMRFGNISNWMTTTIAIGMIGLFSQIRTVTALAAGLLSLYLAQLVIHRPESSVPYTAGTVMILAALGAGYGVALTLNLWTRRSFFLVNAHREQKQAAEQARSLVASLLSATGHDVQQPLQALLLNASRLQAAAETEDLAQTTALAAEQRELLIALNALLSGVLEYSALDSEKRKPEPRRIQAGGLFAQVQRLLGPSAAAHGIELRTVGGAHWLEVDEASTVRILINLVSNALAHAGAGKVLLGARRRADGAVDLIVADDGRGFGPAPVEITDLDSLLTATGKRRRGFGLEIIFALAERAGAPLRLTARPDHGVMAVLTCKPAPAHGG